MIVGVLFGLIAGYVIGGLMASIVGLVFDPGVQTWAVIILFFALIADFQGIVEVELAIDDSPGKRLALGGVALRNGVGAIAAVLRGIALRVLLEDGEVFRTREVPFGALPFRGEGVASFFGRAVLEVRNGVMAADGNAGHQAGKDFGFGSASRDSCAVVSPTTGLSISPPTMSG